MELKSLFEKEGIYPKLCFDLTRPEERKNFLSFFDFTTKSDDAFVGGKSSRKKRV